MSARNGRAALTLAALGVVFGDVGTSPIYALREAFAGPGASATRDADVLGVLSLVTWSLVLVVTLKYVAVVMRADNEGEGGVLALVALVRRPGERGEGWRGRALAALGVFGAALLYGDGMITPAISVLSAVEGLEVVAPRLDPYVVPIALVVLTALFAVQRAGTGGVGRVFGPVMLAWFAALAALGARSVIAEPGVLAALSPHHAALFFARNGLAGSAVLGAVFLTVTGAEALYADLGHFGRGPIRRAWLGLVFPALVVNYYGQGALVLAADVPPEQPFYALAPGWALVPLVVLATAATVIASQAVISGAFSLTVQAVQMGLSPRLTVRHTSAEERGQVYVPLVNASLYVATVALVVGFGSSSALAGAYGVAISITMVATTLLVHRVARRRWGWGAGAATALLAGFLALDLPFAAVNLSKIADGGWVPLVVAGTVYALMTAWRDGQAQSAALRPLPTDDDLMALLAGGPVVRVPGTAAFLSARSDGPPPALLRHLLRDGALHERAVLVTVESTRRPHEGTSPTETEHIGDGVERLVVPRGFLDRPDVPAALMRAGVDPEAATFYLGRRVPEVDDSSPTPDPNHPPLARWRARLYAALARQEGDAADHFGLPLDRVVMLGEPVVV